MKPAVELHPLAPFLPEGAVLLMLGSFPPQRKRWCVDFFYPNFGNDMWRIFGLIFRHDKNFFVDVEAKQYKLDVLIPFLKEKGVAIYDTACAVRRLQDNASDKFLEVVTPTDLPALFHRLPALRAIVTTGQKATDTLCQNFHITPPPVGGFTPFTFENREFRLYRMPSSSRAYPMRLEQKAARYRVMFEALEMCGD